LEKLERATTAFRDTRPGKDGSNLIREGRKVIAPLWLR
jgi:hypothetical protein